MEALASRRSLTLCLRATKAGSSDRTLYSVVRVLGTKDRSKNAVSRYRYLRRLGLPRLAFWLSSPTVPHFDPLPLNPPCDKALCNGLDMLPLHHDFLQLQLSWVRLYGRRRCACHLQSLRETFCVEAEDLKTRHTRDREFTALHHVDRDWVRYTLPS